MENLKQLTVPPSVLLATAGILLLRKINSSNASPFLGHLVLPADRQAGATEAVRRVVRGDPKVFVDLFPKYRLLFAWTVARAVAERYAGDGSPNVYKPIALEIGCDEIPTTLAQELNYYFRGACTRHGLALPPMQGRWNDYVGDYVAQAGVAHSQLSELASAFRRQTDDFGPPPIDETDRLYQWSCEAADRVHPSLTRLRRVIVSDTSGYHATVFRYLLDGLEPTTPFERRFAEAVASVQPKGGARGAPDRPAAVPDLQGRRAVGPGSGARAWSDDACRREGALRLSGSVAGNAASASCNDDVAPSGRRRERRAASPTDPRRPGRAASVRHQGRRVAASGTHRHRGSGHRVARGVRPVVAPVRDRRRGGGRSRRTVRPLRVPGEELLRPMRREGYQALPRDAPEADRGRACGGKPCERPARHRSECGARVRRPRDPRRRSRRPGSSIPHFPRPFSSPSRATRATDITRDSTACLHLVRSAR